MTNPNGLVLDIFQCTDDDRFLELNEDGRERLLEVLEAAVSGTRRRHRPAARPGAQRPAPRQGPALRSGHPRRQSFLAALHDSGYHRQQRDRAAASNQPGDLPSWLRRRPGPDFHRRRRRRSTSFTSPRAGTKLSDAAQAALTADLQRVLEGRR